MKCPKCDFENPADLSFCGKCGTQLGPAEDTSAPPTKTIEVPKQELTTGDVFGDRYQIIEELGKGGMGKVYRVLDKKLNEEVALKLIRPDISSDTKIIERFKTELKLARKIGHPNVGRMYELLEHSGTHYITMEYVAGQDLKGLIKQSGQLAVGTTISITKQVCEGLAEAHRLGVVHRDLKPSNIMIDKEGSARIMDFGIARSLKAKGITGSGVVIGTPEYMSPEQIEAKETDRRSDIYSLGIILYEMLTGRLPFEGDTPLSIAVQHRSEIPKDPRDLNAQIPEGLSLTILKCLAKDKEKRYQTADELRSALDKIEKGIPTTERVAPKEKPITSKEITVRFTLKKLYIPAAAILALAVIAFVVFRKPGPTLNPRRILVAPFENQTGDESHDQIGTVAASWINQEISQTDVVEVVPMATVSQYDNAKDFNINSLARKTEAGTVIAGAYHIVDDALIFSAEITDVKTGNLIESLPPVSGPLEDKMVVIANLQERIKGALAALFDINLGDIPGMRPPLYEAYHEYILGMKRFTTAQSFQHFENAVSLDPEFFLPYLGLAVAHGLLGQWDKTDSIHTTLNQNRGQLSPWESYMLDFSISWLEGNNGKALQHLQKAEELSPNFININHLVIMFAKSTNRPKLILEMSNKINPDNYKEFFSSSLGSLWFRWLADAHHMLGNYKQELKVIDRARKYYPDELFYQEARALISLGRIKEVKELIEQSLARTSPIGQGNFMIDTALELRAQGPHEVYKELANQTVEWLEDTLSKKEATARQRRAYALALYAAERWDKARIQYEELSAEHPDNINYIGYLGIIAARKGERETALQISEELKNMNLPYLRGQQTYWRACIEALLGEKEQAFNLLKESLSNGQSYSVSLLSDMDLEPLRDYKPFQDLLKPKD